MFALFLQAFLSERHFRNNIDPPRLQQLQTLGVFLRRASSIARLFAHFL